MTSIRSHISVLLSILATSLAPTERLVAQTRPAIEFGTLLNDLRVLDDGRVSLARLTSGYLVAFLPGDKAYDPNNVARSGGHRLWASIRKDGKEVGKSAFHVQRFNKVFSRAYSCPDSSKLQQEGFSQDIKLPGSGRYELVFFLDQQALTRIAFEVELVQSGDPFNPGSSAHIDGPWKDLARLVSMHGREDPQVSFEMWAKRREQGSDQYEVKVKHEGDVVAVGRKRSVSSKNWGKLNFGLSYPRGLGRGVYRRSHLLKKDGRYDIVVTKSGKPYGVWSFVAKGGKVTPHARQALGYKPHGDWLMPRGMDLEKHNGWAYDWMLRADAKTATARANAAPAAAKAIPASVRKAWVVEAKAKPAKAAPVLSNCVTRGDAAIGVGDGVIAFGTGGYTGVAWMRCSDGKTQSVPNGQNLLAKALGACGRKFVFVDRKKLVSVFDCDSGKLETLPATTMQLERLFGGPNKGGPIACSGRLAFVVNDPTKVADRRMFKVLDLSQSKPRIYSLRNVDGLLPRDVSDVAIDAARGQVAIASKRKAKIWTADIAEGAALREHDLSGNDGVSTEPIVLREGLVEYRDDASRRLARRLDVASGKASSSPAALADLTRSQSWAFGSNDALFRAGTGSIGSGEFLELFDGKAWTKINGPSASPIAASDVHSGPGLIVFKHGKSSRVAIGYLIVGG